MVGGPASSIKSRIQGLLDAQHVIIAKIRLNNVCRRLTQLIDEPACKLIAPPPTIAKPLATPKVHIEWLRKSIQPLANRSTQLQSTTRSHSCARAALGCTAIREQKHPTMIGPSMLPAMITLSKTRNSMHTYCTSRQTHSNPNTW